jgi:flagellar motor switch protein FliN
VTTEHALRELARSTADAAAAVLGTFLPGGVEVGEPEVVAAGTSPLEGPSVPAVAAEVHYTDGASGGNLFVATVPAVRKLAAAMMRSEAGDGTEPLDELERSAVAEAMNQMMAAAAGATSTVLGADVEISTPEVTDIASVADALALGEGAPQATRVALTVAGEPCRLVQLVPKAFVVKMTRALDDLAATELPGAGEGADARTRGADDILRGVPLRVCAEIGRATMPLNQAVSLPDGGLVELDRGAEEPVDVLVNGRRFATGRLVLVEDEWAVRIEEVLLDADDLRRGTPTAIERS